MLTPEQLQALPNRVLDVYDDLELDILLLMAENFKKIIENKSKKTLVVRAQNAAIRLLLLSYNRKIRKKVRETLKEAVARVNTAHVKTAAIIKGAEREILKELKQVKISLPFVCEQNLLNTLFEVTKKASLEVLSAKETYETAIAEGIKKLSGLGLTLKKKNGVREHLDVVVRRHVMTYTSRAAARVSLLNMFKLGFKYVEVSAHSGARNKGVGWQNHESWQGKVYEVKDMGKALGIAMLPRPIGYN